MEDAGFVTGAFDAHEVFEFIQSEIRKSCEQLQGLLDPLVGQRAPSASPRSNTRRSPDSSPYQTGVSAAASDSSDSAHRMTLGPNAAAMFAARRQSPKTGSQKTATARDAGRQIEDPATRAVSNLVQQLMSFMARETPQRVQAATTTTGESSDVNMKSVGYDFDPDDMGAAAWTQPARTVATASTQGMAPLMRMSVISDLKEFSGKDGDEDLARAWLSELKSAFARDETPDVERCLVFADRLTGPTRYWHR